MKSRDRASIITASGLLIIAASSPAGSGPLAVTPNSPEAAVEALPDKQAWRAAGDGLASAAPPVSESTPGARKFSKQVDRHIALLEVGSVDERIHAAMQLANLGRREHKETGQPMNQVEARRAVPALIKAAETTGREAPLNIPRAMGRLLAGTAGPETDMAVKWLIRMIETNTNNLAYPAVRALADIGPAAAPAAPALVKLLNGLDPHDGGTALILRALGKLGPDAKSSAPAIRSFIPKVRPKPPRNDDGYCYIEANPADLRLSAYATLDRMGAIQAADALPIAKDMAEATRALNASSGAAILLRMKDLPPEIASHVVRALAAPGREWTGSTIRNGPQEVIKVLARLGSAAAIPLVQRLDMKKVSRYRVLRALRALGPKAKPALPNLVAVLRRQTFGNPEAYHGFSRAYPITETIAVVGPDAIPTLTSLLDEKDDYLRCMAVAVLGGIGKETLPYVKHALDDESALVRTMAHITLIEFGESDEKHVEGVCQAAAGDDPRALGLTAWALGARYPLHPHRMRKSDRLATLARNPKVIACLLPLARAENAHARRLAIRRLGALRPTTKEIVAVLIRALADEDRDNRVHAAEALGRMKRAAAEAVPALSKMTKDPDVGPRNAALRALASIRPKDEEIEKQLLDALADPQTARTARTLLQQLGLYHKHLPALMQELRSAGEAGELRAAIFEVASLGAKAEPAIPLLIKHLDSDESAIVDAAAYALRKLPVQSRAAIPALTRAARADYSSARIYAMASLRTLEARSAAPAIMAKLDHPSPGVRKRAARWLGQMRIVDAADRLVDSLNDDDVAVRVDAAVALGRIGQDVPKGVAPRIQKQLQRLLKDANAKVQVSALFALIRMGVHDEDGAHTQKFLDFLSHDNVVVRDHAAMLLRELDVAPTRRGQTIEDDRRGVERRWQVSALRDAS